MKATKALLVTLIGLSLLAGCSASLSLGDSDTPRSSSKPAAKPAPAAVEQANMGGEDF